MAGIAAYRVLCVMLGGLREESGLLTWQPWLRNGKHLNRRDHPYLSSPCYLIPLDSDILESNLATALSFIWSIFSFIAFMLCYGYSFVFVRWRVMTSREWRHRMRSNQRGRLRRSQQQRRHAPPLGWSYWTHVFGKNHLLLMKHACCFISIHLKPNISYAMSPYNPLE